MINYADVMIKAERIRNKLGEDNKSPLDIFALVQTIEGLTLVFYPMGDSISGMCIKGKNNNCTIAINSSMTLGRQRFSLAHELYHLYYDANMRSICAKNIGDGKSIEKEADAFAANLLMPRIALEEKVEVYSYKNGGTLSIEDIIRIEQYFGVSHQAALYQLYNCHLIDKAQLEDWKTVSVRKKALSMGFSADLYKKSSDEKKYYTIGHYINQVDILLQKGLISNGKYEELLLDGFRGDLVYGIEEDGELID